MFLDSLRRRNSAFVMAAALLHQRRELPANSFVLDLDAVARNSRRITDEASRLGLEVLAMTKQVGRHPDFIEVLRANGISACVAVDMDCARANTRAGLPIGNLGHLVQIPVAEAASAARLCPANWTVFSLEKAREVSNASEMLGRVQDLLLRVYSSTDKFYPGHEGGFDLEDLSSSIRAIKKLSGTRVAGVTTFPALVYDEVSKSARLTPNVTTLARAAEQLSAAGVAEVIVNMPGTTSSSVLEILANAGATQVEPGHGLTGTTPLHAFSDLEEEPACLYLSEVSHHYQGRAYFFGGGLYIDPVFAEYSPQALAFPPDGGEPILLPVQLPPPEMIDYYGQLTNTTGQPVPVGSSVILGFRFQAFVTRAHVVGIDHIGDGGRVRSVCTPSGSLAQWSSEGSSL